MKSEKQGNLLDDIRLVTQEIQYPPLHPNLDKETVLSLLKRCERYILEDPDTIEIYADADDLAVVEEELINAVSSFKKKDVKAAEALVRDALQDTQDMIYY